MKSCKVQSTVYSGQCDTCSVSPQRTAELTRHSQSHARATVAGQRQGAGATRDAGGRFTRRSPVYQHYLYVPEAVARGKRSQAMLYDMS
jgi:hypothetical protein